MIRLFVTMSACLVLLFLSAFHAMAAGPQELWTQRSANYDPDLFSGASVYEVPINLPQGRLGFTPTLSLNYSSLRQNNDSIVGYGWDVNMSRIVRRPETSIMDMYDDGLFTLELDGRVIELVSETLTSGEYGSYVVEVETSETFYQIEFVSDDSWTVTTKQGVVYTFGSSADSRIDNPSDSTQIYAWYLEDVRDQNDNYMTYTYYADNSVLYPETILYTGNGTTDGPFTVRFEPFASGTPSARDDISTSYTPGFELSYQYLLESIEIDVDSEGTVGTYDLTYTTGDNGYRSMLESVTRNGLDSDGNPIALEPWEFSYTEATDSWTDVSSTWNFSNEDHPTSSAAYADFSGDGVVDTQRSTYVDPYYDFYMYEGGIEGVSETTSEWTFVDYSIDGADSIVRDLNNDGTVDIITSSFPAGDPSIQWVLLNDGDKEFTDVTSTWLPNMPSVDFDDLDGDVGTADLNGDGLLDIIETCVYTGCPNSVWNGNGIDGWDEATSDYDVEDLNLRTSGLMFFDVNGDGLDDVWLSDTYAEEVELNNGNGEFINVTEDWNLAPGPVSSPSKRLVDINGDGYVDVVILGNTSVYMGDATGWHQEFMTSFPGSTTGCTDCWRIYDFDGDGLMDIVFESTTGQEAWLHDGVKPDLLSTVIAPEGMSVDFTYTSSAQLLDDTGDPANPELPFVFPVVTSVTVDDGLGNTTTTSYTYEDGVYSYTDVYDGRFAGFGVVTTTYDDGTSIQNYFYQNGGYDGSAFGEQEDTFEKIGKSYRREILDASGNTLQTTIDVWEQSDLSTERAFVYRSDEVIVYAGDSGDQDTATSFVYDEATGNVSSMVEYGEVNASDDGSFTDTGTDDRTTSYTYATDSADVLRSLLSGVTITDTDAVTAQEERLTYDGLAWGSVATGNVTAKEIWISGSDYAETDFTYDAYGNVLTTTDPLGNITTTAYDSWFMYPATITNALSQTQTLEYDLTTGQQTYTEAVNGTITEADYDTFGRQSEERRSSTTDVATLETTQTWEYDDTSSPRSATHRTYLSSTLYAEAITYFDGLGRPVEVKTLGEDASGYVEAETTYDAKGRVASQTLPATASGSSYDSGTVSSDLATEYTYDSLDRLTTVADIIGTMTTSYDGFTTSVVDSVGNQKDTMTDGLGRVIEIVEYLDATSYTTSYEYDATDRLTSLEDVAGNTRTFTYDGRGSRLTAEDLHGSSDTSYGIWTYTYDDAGNMQTSLSPNNVTVTYAYDELNRVESEDADDATGVEVTYVYDACSNGTGLLCEAVSDGATMSYAYDAAGNISAETTVIDGTDYATNYSYDRQANVLTVTHPDGTVVTNTYNALGKIETIDDVVTDTDYGPHGKVTSQTHADGTTVTYTYDETQRYRLSQKVTEGFVSSGMATATTTIYASAGDGSMYKNGSTWDAVHDATSASGANATGTIATVRSGLASSGIYSMNRTFLAFDTSSLPADATITGATVYLYVTGVVDGDNDGDDWITIVEGSQASASTLTTADWDTAGSVDAPTEGIDSSDRIDLTSVATGSYTRFPLNVDGQSWISLTGDTKLALREGHDALDNTYAGGGGTENKLQFRTSEYSGTASDPYLEISYTYPATSSTVATLQDLTYTYDDVGNITSIVDASDTDTAKTIAYTYDDWYRLESATVSGSADGDDGMIMYTYDEVGNITYRSDLGTYAYDGTDYANPHAVTSIELTDGTTVTYEYDSNGNLTDDGTSAYIWDYKNRLTSSGALSETSGTTTSTVTIYSSAGDGSMYNNSSSWDTAHDATSASGANPTGSYGVVRSGLTAVGIYSLNRAFLAFDTSSIPDDATITDTTLNLYVASKADDDNDGDDWLTVVESSQASASTLTTADWDTAGSVDSPTEGIDASDRVDLTSVSTGAYLPISLNTTGQSWISLTGDTKLALREGHDALDSVYAGSGGTENKLVFRTSEYTGTASDPYLEITYEQTTSGTTTSDEVTYVYDYAGRRVSKTADSAATYYPTSDYSVSDGVATIYVSGPSGLVAQMENDGTTSTTQTIHTDHLGSTSVVTDEEGIMIELLDYNPYGSSRSSWSSESSDGEAESNKTYIGEYSDDETGLSYLNARYYDPTRGQFLSQDPLFYEMPAKWLMDPLAQNAYAYARGNPVKYVDPNGESWEDWLEDTANAFTAVVNVATAVTPIVNDLRDGIEVVSGRDAISGQQLTQDQMALTGMGVFAVGSISGKELRVLAEVAEGLDSARHGAKNSPDFVVTPGGTSYPVPTGATGPVDVISPTSGRKTGSAFTGGAGGANGQVDTIRIMDANDRYQNGYIKYENSIQKGQQGVDPYTGKTGSRENTHFPID